MEKEKITIDDLARMIKEDVVDKMATKEDLAEVKNDLVEVKTDLRDFKQENRQSFKEVNEKLDLVIEDVANHSERIEALEEKVGI